MVVAIGLGAGLAGAIAMTFGEKIEQIFTGRPNSLVPGLTLARLLGKPDSSKTTLNLPMHYGQVRATPAPTEAVVALLASCTSF